MDSNSLTTLPPSFGKLVALKSLALDMNQLGALPACVCELTALERLTLGAIKKDEFARARERTRAHDVLHQSLLAGLPAS